MSMHSIVVSLLQGTASRVGGSSHDSPSSYQEKPVKVHVPQNDTIGEFHLENTINGPEDVFPQVRSDLLPLRGEAPGDFTFCPVTGFLAFKSFCAIGPNRLRKLLRDYREISIAIGDVDDFKSYVEAFDSGEPTMNGHVAGNIFMARLGAISLNQFHTTNHHWTCMSSFGGDEFVFASAGVEHNQFSNDVRLLSSTLSEQLPRSVSFAVGRFAVDDEDLLNLLTTTETQNLWMSSLSIVDRELVSFKVKRRNSVKNSKVGPEIAFSRTRWLNDGRWSLSRPVRQVAASEAE